MLPGLILKGYGSPVGAVSYLPLSWGCLRRLVTSMFKFKQASLFFLPLRVCQSFGSKLSLLFISCSTHV